ncbi:polysaccharide deacetylase family protein [uncultured Marinobacter sp.]|uniref:polysaccharide deacetylase family protein n=1 Tax=uncultured Marinobacter sp. TaxID=187379 RepID=UPI000C09EDF1|nr:polysaccharide deacetylase [Marinobacter sp.]MBI42634.1 polysaccharide deacetylase [Oceanospirillales bacterium]
MRNACHLLAILLATLLTGAAKADLAVLQYHHVSDATPPSTSTSVSLFEAQLDMIAELGLEVVPLQRGTEAALTRTDDHNQVAISFDDAYASVYTNAAPRLQARGWPYTIFVNTDAVGRPGYMTWAQLAELAARDGVTIANHSADHGHLARAPGESESAWQTRVADSLDRAQRTLNEKLGAEVPMLAYPYGEFDAGLASEVARRGWLGFGQHSGPIGPQSDRRRLPRFPMANAFGQLGSLRDKLLSRALPVDAAALPDGIVDSQPPTLVLTLPDGFDPKRLTCFASGQGRIPVQADNDYRVRVTAPRPIDSRRFRYNCTYPAGNGRYYWLSQPWLDLRQPED